MSLFNLCLYWKDHTHTHHQYFIIAATSTSSAKEVLGNYATNKKLSDYFITYISLSGAVSFDTTPCIVEYSTIQSELIMVDNDVEQALNKGAAQFKFDAYRAIAIAEGFESADSDEEIIAAWQYISDNGLHHGLQGFFGRTVAQLIETGVITPPKSSSNE